MIKRIDTIDRFQARGDDGETYSVVIQQEIIHAGDLENPNAEIAGMKRVMLSDGEPCNRLSDERYMVVSTDVTLTRM